MNAVTPDSRTGHTTAFVSWQRRRTVNVIEACRSVDGSIMEEFHSILVLRWMSAGGFYGRHLNLS